jgi:hypothetical protein
MTRVYSRSRDEDGSIIVAMMVIFVATALIVSVVALVYSSMRTTRRYGDSANALQLADAAVNDAVKDIPSAVANNMPLQTKVLGTAGSYTYSATLDPAAPIWHIDAVGIDNSGVKRHVKAEASPESLFSNAFFVDSALALPSGVLMDSFTSGSTAQTMCTRKGILGTNNPANLSFNSSGGNGTAQKNCTDAVWGAGQGTYWPYPVDGCVGYHDPSAPAVLPDPNNVGQPNHCPPEPYTKVATPKYSIPSVSVPNGTTFVTQSSSTGAGGWPQFPCDATHPITGGQRYYVSQVRLLPGCQVDATNGPALIYTTGSVSIGIQNGGASSNRSPGMNPPTSNSLICNAYAGTDTHSNPASYYCPGWSSNLQIYMTDGNTNSINFGNSAKFWGVIMGQNAQIATAPQVEMWGALRVGGLAGSSQLSLHYDEALGSISTGVYTIKSWREEPN